MDIMDTSRISSKGQVVIPKPIRDALNLESGTEVRFDQMGNGVRLTVVRRRKHSDPRAGYGLARYRGPTVSLEQMEEAVRKGVRESR